MRDYAKISTSVWRSRKFRTLRGNDRARLLYLYLHTCAQVNSVGCYSLPLGYVQTDLQWDEKACREAIETLSIAGLIAWDEVEELVRIIDFIEHDPPTNPKHADALAKVAFSLPDCREKLCVIKDLIAQKHQPERHELASERGRLSKAYGEGIETPTPYPIPLSHSPTKQQDSSATPGREVDEPAELPDPDPVLAEARNILAVHAEETMAVYALTGWQPYRDDMATAKSLARAGFGAARARAAIRSTLERQRDRGERPPRSLAYFEEQIRKSADVVDMDEILRRSRAGETAAPAAPITDSATLARRIVGDS